MPSASLIERSVYPCASSSDVTRYVIIHDIRKVVRNINLKEEHLAKIEGRPPIIFEHLHPHAFRHTFATRCFEKKLDPLFVQNIMGHANYATTVSYAHVLDDIRQKVISQVGDFLTP